MSEISTLGERIRKLRKQRGLTLEELAGDALTKGMLSLIENNRSKPSMESLTYIAERLNVMVSELLEEVSSTEVKEVLDEAEKLYYLQSELLIGKKDEDYKNIIHLIEPYAEKLTRGYEAGRLLDLYGRSLSRLNKEGWERYLDRATAIYDEMNLTNHRAEVGIFRSMRKFIAHQYKEALQILLKEKAEIEQNHAYIDPLTRLELDYNEAVLQFAVGNQELALQVMEQAINFSRKERIFYLIDNLYRLALGYAIMCGDEEKMHLYDKKLKQFTDFSEDLFSKINYEFMKAGMLLTWEKKYPEVLAICDRYTADHSLDETFKSFFYLLKGISHYGLGQFEEALRWLEKVTVPKFIHHPFDLSMLYTKDAYRALCHFELGERDRAKRFAQTAWERIRSFPKTVYQDFIKKTYEMIEKQTDE